MEIIQTYELTKYYRSGLFNRKNIQALEKVSLTINEGEIFGLLGPNGAGKTTFVKLVLSIALPTSGNAKVFGLDIGTTALKENCGYLPENHRYPSFLSAANTLKFFGRLNGIPNSELNGKVSSLLELVGLKDWAKIKTKKFSKGMMQRLGLAQALINDPKLLFLDEPTDGVDPIGRKEIRDLLLELKAKGVTIFLNSHLLSEVEMICDRVAILNKGRVVRIGTINELTAHKLIYTIQLSAPISDVIKERLRSSLLRADFYDNKVIVELRDTSELNFIIDLLRNDGIGIESMTQQKTSLEEYFIQLVKGENEN